MTRKEIIDGLKFTVEMFLLDPSTGKTITEPRNDMDKITIDACKGAIELLEQEPKWFSVSERLPQINEWVVCQCRANIYEVLKFTSYGWYHDDAHCYMDGFVIAWMPLPQPYKTESEDKNEKKIL